MLAVGLEVMVGFLDVLGPMMTNLVGSLHKVVIEDASGFPGVLQCQGRRLFTAGDDLGVGA